jgi:hypothetical protein
MDELDFKEILKEAVNSTISNSIDNSNLYRTLFLEFSKSCSDIVEKLKQENKIIVEAFKDVALTFGIDHQNIWDVEHAVTTLKREIVKRSETDRPKQRYLIYGYSDDCGHSHCYCVASKNLEDVDTILSSLNDGGGLEHVYVEDSKLIKAMSDKLSCKIDELMNMKEENLMENIEDFFKAIIADEALTREEFSEYVECLINDSRHSNRSKNWVAI